MVKQDYIMRLIHDMVRTVLRLVFGIDEEKEEVVFLDAKEREIYDRLIKMADSGEINEAENLLYEELDIEDKECLKRALLFYNHLNEMDDETLERADFSREEIREGVENILCKFGYDGLPDIF
ncbi:MAG: hypothetical protein IJA27_07860 [Lachnospiraceae bacterium]|nr:hypothetical protein [Lachnospiraceae bacterium]